MNRDKGMAAVGTKIHFARSKGSQTTMCGKRIDARVNQEATVDCKRCLNSLYWDYDRS